MASTPRKRRARITLVTTPHAGRLLRLSHRSVWRLIDIGWLRPAGKIGNSNVFYKDEVLQLKHKLSGRK